ncbi:MAG: hypothetical protein U0Q16_06900 [Bryobacteraceae bacterium]
MPISKDEAYDVWRPRASLWTPWVKPVLFAFLDEVQPGASPDSTFLRKWDVPLEQATAIVVDLPAAEGVIAGLALARVGYRPIPVYNACPFPLYDPEAVSQSILAIGYADVPVAVDVIPIMRAILRGTEALRECSLAQNAPPVFLVDRNRAGHGRPDIDWFDNRSFVSAADFPSADFLKQRGIHRVIVVGPGGDPGRDLTSVLIAWQSAGLEFSYQDAWVPWKPEIKPIRVPAALQRLWWRLSTLVGYPARENGAFGEWVRASNS